MIDLEAKVPVSTDYGNGDKLDITQLDLVVDVPNIDQYPNEQYAILRKHGLGTSDSSIVCGVNPYTTQSELIQEKCRDYLTPEEKAVGDKTAVRKGRDLEPFIIERFSRVMGKRIIKPTDMYHHKDFNWLKFNFDGVIDKATLEGKDYQYIPAEIKVVTQYGIKHYDPTKAWFRESMGMFPLPVDHSKENNSIETKAAEYGIPPYYYTQLQQQIYGLNAPFGYLTVLFDSTWELVSFFVWRDDACIQEILTNGFKIWNKVCQLTGQPHREDVSGMLAKTENKENPI